MVELQRLAVIGDGAIEIVLGLICLAPAQEGGGRFRLRRDCGAIIGDRAVEISFCPIDRRAIGKGESRLWIELECLVEIGDGLIEIALGLIGAAPVDKGYDPIALRFLASSGDDLGATGDARVGIGAATPRPRIVFGETIGAERKAKQPSECDTRQKEYPGLRRGKDRTVRHMADRAPESPIARGTEHSRPRAVKKSHERENKQLTSSSAERSANRWRL